MSRNIPTLFIRDAACTTVEYSVLVALICGLLLTVSSHALDRFDGAFADVSGSLQGARDRGSTAPALIAVRGSSVGSDESTTMALLTPALLALAIGGWFIERRARLVRPQSKSENGSAVARRRSRNEPARSLLAKKRLQILNMLINDNHKLLPSDLRVRDLMTTNVRTARPSSTVGELREMISEYKFRHVLICNSADELVGVVSDRDLRKVDDGVSAGSIMAARPMTVAPDALVNEAITALLYGHISSLPVVQDGRLMGILTTTDVVMTLQCTMLAVEQMVLNLRAGRSNDFSNL